MSKKRMWSLTSKSKLSKRLEDYKEHKTKKKGLGYAEEDPVMKRKPGIRKYPCKKLKGEHDFELTDSHEFTFWKEICDTYVCKACGKIKHKYRDKNEDQKKYPIQD